MKHSKNESHSRRMFYLSGLSLRWQSRLDRGRRRNDRFLVRFPTASKPKSLSVPLLISSQSIKGSFQGCGHCNPDCKYGSIELEQTHAKNWSTWPNHWKTPQHKNNNKINKTNELVDTHFDDFHFRQQRHWSLTKIKATPDPYYSQW